MKKAVMILIGIIYVASIILISLFGMKAIIHKENIPVTRIECTNITEGKVTVKTLENGKKQIWLKYDKTVGATNTLELKWKVYPEEATNKTITFIYDRNNPNITFLKDSDGNETGYVSFSGKVNVDVSIKSTDGSNISTQIEIKLY